MSIENAFLVELRRIIDSNGRGFQAEICRAMGMKPASLSNMISGRRGMSEDERIKIAAIVGMDYEGLRRVYIGSQTFSITHTGTGQAAQHSGAGNIVADSGDGMTITGYDEYNPPAGVGQEEFSELLYWLKRHPAMAKKLLETARKIGGELETILNG